MVTSLVVNGESLDEVSLAGRCRTDALRRLCHMHPARASHVQTLALQNCKHPTLLVTLALEAEEEWMRWKGREGGREGEEGGRRDIEGEQVLW